MEVAGNAGRSGKGSGARRHGGTDPARRLEPLQSVRADVARDRRMRRQAGRSAYARAFRLVEARGPFRKTKRQPGICVSQAQFLCQWAESGMNTSPETVSVRRFFDSAQAQILGTFIDYQAKRVVPYTAPELWTHALDANGATKTRKDRT